MTKLIGMIGGVSWESTVLYYKLINQAVRERLGGLNSAKLLIYSLNYDPIVEYERQGNWKAVADILVTTAKNIEDAGCHFLILGCNTLHKVSESIEAAIRIPFLHIADATAITLLRTGVKKIGLLGTQFTMEDGFYKKRLHDKYGIDVIIPSSNDCKLIDDIIYNELCMGKIMDDSRQKLSSIMASLVTLGVQGILLACTELGMLVQPDDSSVPIFDTTALHVDSVVKLYFSSPQ
jgi:aspartate racemase